MVAPGTTGEDTSGATGLRVTGVSKAFGAVSALSEASLDVAAGTVHALLGANGAGKSTLVKIVTGVITADAGSVELDGTAVSFASPFEAREAGVATVFQDPPLFPALTVAENIFAGAYPRTGAGLVGRKETQQQASAVLARLGISLPPQRLVASLSTAEREFVAIARALQRDSRVLILDEPTSSLTPDETEKLFQVVRRYRDGGGAVLFISHRMEEIRKIADQITIFRDGTDIFVGRSGSLSDDEVIEMIMGEEARHLVGVGPATLDPTAPREVLLSVDRLSLDTRVHEVSMELRRGEIVVLAGLVGSGRSEFVETVMGLYAESSGTVTVGGRKLGRRNPRSMARHGVALVPEDRDTQGLIYGFSIGENIGMGSTRKTNRLGFLRRRAEQQLAKEQVASLHVRAAGLDADVASLSGGNRQKVVLGKWLATRPGVLLLDEPTKGVDVGAKAEIHAILRRLAREEGLGVLVVSSDLDEVLDLADRVLVMRAGTIVSEFEGAAANEHDIMAAAASASSRATSSATGDEQ